MIGYVPVALLKGVDRLVEEEVVLVAEFDESVLGDDLTVVFQGEHVAVVVEDYLELHFGPFYALDVFAEEFELEELKRPISI